MQFGNCVLHGQAQDALIIRTCDKWWLGLNRSELWWYYSLYLKRKLKSKELSTYFQNCLENISSCGKQNPCLCAKIHGSRRCSYVLVLNFEARSEVEGCSICFNRLHQSIASLIFLFWTQDQVIRKTRIGRGWDNKATCWRRSRGVHTEEEWVQTWIPNMWQASKVNFNQKKNRPRLLPFCKMLDPLVSGEMKINQ